MEGNSSRSLVLSYVRNWEGSVVCPALTLSRLKWGDDGRNAKRTSGDQGTDWKDTTALALLSGKKYRLSKSKEMFNIFERNAPKDGRTEKCRDTSLAARNSAAVQQGSQVDFMCQLFKRQKHSSEEQRYRILKRDRLFTGWILKLVFALDGGDQRLKRQGGRNRYTSNRSARNIFR